MWNANIHIFVDLLASSLVLESCLGKIYRKHTGNTHQSSNSAIDKFSREACEKHKRANEWIIVIVFLTHSFIPNPLLLYTTSRHCFESTEQQYVKRIKAISGWHSCKCNTSLLILHSQCVRVKLTKYNNTTASKVLLLITTHNKQWVCFHTWLVAEPWWEVGGLVWGLS